MSPRGFEILRSASSKRCAELDVTFTSAVACSARGMVVFIDEADAFLAARGAARSEPVRAAINALLYRTGDQSRDFMVVLATNRPGAPAR